MKEYPKALYLAALTACVIANNEDEETALRKKEYLDYAETSKAIEKTSENPADTDDDGDLSRAEIMAALDSAKVEYKKNASTESLVKLLEQHNDTTGASQ